MEPTSERSPSPADVCAAICRWLDRYWDAPREKSKPTDVAMVFLTILVVVAAFLSAYYFQKQLDVMRRQFEATDRPWITVEVTANTDYVPGAFIGGPLTFDPDGSAHLTWKYTLKNIGRSVANQVYIRETALTMSPFDPHLKLPLEMQRDLCGKPRTTAGILTIFPNETKEVFASKVVDTKDVKDMPELRLKRGKPVTFFVAGCVDYQFATSTANHQTGYIYQVWGSKTHQGIQVGTTIPVDQLSFEPYPFEDVNAY